jgi:hypothetical protein
MSNTLLPGRHKVRVEAEGRFPWLSDVEVLSGQDLGITLGPTNLPERRRWPARVAYGTAGLAGLSLAAGGFLGVLSQLNPTGSTRAEIQRDTDQKHQLAVGANAAFITGGALAVISLIHFIALPRRHLRPVLRRLSAALVFLAVQTPLSYAWYRCAHIGIRAPGRAATCFYQLCANGAAGNAEMQIVG